MTSRERLLHTLRREPVDCVPVRIWGFDHRKPPEEPSRQALAEIARPYQPDLLNYWRPEIHGGEDQVQKEETTVASSHAGYMESRTIVHTPKGDLSSAYLWSPEGKPGYQAKYLLETPEEAEKWLSIPWSPPVVDASGWQAANQALGEDGLLLVMLSEPMYHINLLTGSEVWAYWLMDERELLHRLVSEAQRRQVYIIKQLLGAGVVGLYGYVGPELCIPPLASPRDFDDFVVRYDKPLHDLIHAAGGQMWVHCDGKMGSVLERFADEGVDCLNPLEPSPMGDVTLAEARARVGSRMSFDGSLPIGDLELKTPAEMEEQVTEAIRQSGGTGLILCYSSTLSHWPTLPPRVVENLEVFLKVGRREGRKVCA